MKKSDAPYFEYLDELRESGRTNMFAAAIFLARRFPEIGLDRNLKTAHAVLARWMDSYREREIVR